MPVTASTPANLVIGAGDVYVDAAALGATQEHNLFRIEQEFFVPALNGLIGSLIGTHYKTREEAILEVSLPEIAAAKVALQWPGSQSDVAGDVTTIDSDGTRRIPTADYHDWELRIPGLDGREFSFFADNGLNQANAEFDAADDGDLAPRLEIHSTWDAAALTASPHRIVITNPGS